MNKLFDNIYIDKLYRFLGKEITINITENTAEFKLDWQSSFLIQESKSFGENIFFLCYKERGIQQMQQAYLNHQDLLKAITIRLKMNFSKKPDYRKPDGFDKINDIFQFEKFMHQHFCDYNYSIEHMTKGRLCLMSNSNKKYNICVLLSNNECKYQFDNLCPLEAYSQFYNEVVFFEYYSNIIKSYEIEFNNHTPTNEEIIDYIYN